MLLLNICNEFDLLRVLTVLEIGARVLRDYIMHTTQLPLPLH